MLKRLIALVFLAPIGIILIVLAVTNRHPVTIGVPPYVGETPFLSFSVPVFVLVFAAVLAGIFLGGFGTWVSQGKHRKLARSRKVDASKWQFEADKEKKRADELAQKVAATDTAASLPSPNEAA